MLSDRISVHHLTAPELSAPDFIDAAASAGCRKVALFVQSTNRPGVHYPVIAAGEAAAAARRRLADAGVSAHALDAFILRPDTTVADFAPALAVGAELGGRRITALVGDDDQARAYERFCALCDLAREYGLAVHLEFHAMSAIRSLAGARAFLGQGLPEGAGIAVDSLHLFRAGEDPDAIRCPDPVPVAYAQLCDGPASVPADRVLDEMVNDRGVPGEGTFDLDGFVRALPPEVVIDLEVPCRALRECGMAPADIVRTVVAAGRTVIEAACR